MSVPEYTAGEWIAVVRPGFVALLGPDVTDATARAVWDAADGGVLDVLAVIARGGFAGLPPFALVSVQRRRVHVALRGEVEVVVGSDVLSSGEVSTWTERVVDDAAAVTVRAAGVAAGVELPLGEGIVRASGVRVALVPDEAVDAAVPEAVPADDVAAEPVPDGDHVDVQPAAVEPPAELVAEAVAAEPSEAAAADEAAADEAAADQAATDQALDEKPASDEPAGADVPEEPVAFPFAAAQPSAPVPTPGSEGAHDDAAEVVAAAEAFLAAAPLPASPFPDALTSPESAAAPVVVEGATPDDHDGMTILSSDLAAIRDQLPAWAAADAPASFREPEPVGAPARIVLSTGLVVELDRAVLVGRAPQVSRVANRELPRLVTVPSPQQDISRTHAEVRAEGDVVLVTDLDSTNGVHVTRDGEGARRLHPGEPSVVDAGEVVDLGDGVTFTVERGA